MNSRPLDHYLRRGHRQVKGWLEPGAAQSVVLLSTEQKRANVSGGVAEIGVHHGRLFIVLYLVSAEDEPAVAIDLFSLQELNIERSGCGDLERFRENLRKHAGLERLVVHEGDSTQLAAADLLRLGRGPLRLISIDGGHTPEITAHDLATAEGALADGGIIVLDDCFNGMWPGVAEGVFRHFSQPRSIVPFGIGAGKVFFCHPPFANRYAAALRTLNARAVEHAFLGCRVVCLDFTPPARVLRRLYHAMRTRFSR